MSDTESRLMEDVCLQRDNGADLSFRGRVFAENSWYDTEQSSLTRQKLYVTDSNEHVYSIINHQGEERQRRAYHLAVAEDHCVVRHGNTETVLQFDLLMLAVRSLCGLGAGSDLSDAEHRTDMALLEKGLKAANA